MHAALLRWPSNVSLTTTTATRLLAIFRLSDAELPPADAPPALTSSLHYMMLDGASLQPIGSHLGEPRLLPLPTPPTEQLLSGPEDARLFSLAGRACLIYNDVQRDGDRGASASGGDRDEPTSSNFARWRMRRGLYLSCLSARTGSDALLPSYPIALRPSATVARVVGSTSDVEKNWVPFVRNGTLLFSYSLDPHVILRIQPEELEAALTAAEGAHVAGAEEARLASSLALEADVVHVTRFASADESAQPSRPSMRGGTPPVRIGGRHVAFMHAVYKRPCQPPQCRGNTHQSLYTVAAYAFASSPPYAIEAISPPFMLGGHTTPYPIGLVATKKHLLLSYGVADRDWHIAKLSREELLATLVPVATEDLTQATLSKARQASGRELPSHRIHLVRGTPASVREALASG